MLLYVAIGHMWAMTAAGDTVKVRDMLGLRYQRGDHIGLCFPRRFFSVALCQIYAKELYHCMVPAR